jgi:transposase
VVNRVQKLLEGANIKLASVASNVMGVSARAMLTEIASGENDAGQLADLARGRLRSKIPQLEKALTGLVGSHHRFLLSKQLTHIEFLDEQIVDIEAEIARQVEGMPPLSPPPTRSEDSPAASSDQLENELTWKTAVELLDSIPGVNECTAQAILAEIGLDMNQFPTAKHLAAWAGLAPGNHQSGGKRYSGRTKKGSPTITSTMVQAAWSAVRVKEGSFLKSRYRRLAARRGKKRAIVAVAHSMLVSVWHMLTKRQPYQELGGDFFDQRRKEAKVNYLTRQLEKLTGGLVHIELQPTPV